MTQYQAPTDAQVSEAVRRILNPQLRRAFFEGLKNPLWLEPLARLGLFESPPEPEKRADGLVYDRYWPEIDYLIRVSPDEPSQVVDLLLKLDQSNNAWVKRATFTIGSKIPADQAARLKPLLKKWLSNGFGWRSDPDEMVGLVINLLTNGQRPVGLWLANVLFKPMPSQDESPSHWKHPVLFMREHWYDAGLARVVAELMPADLQMVTRWLKDYERYSGHFTDTHDTTYLVRESVRLREGLGTRDSPEQFLIEATRDLAARAVLGNTATSVDTLISSGMVLGRKIALFALAEGLKVGGLSLEQEADLLASAQSLLFDEKSRDESCRIEYGELAREIAEHDRSVLNPLTDFLDAGPLIEVDELRRRLRRDDEESPEEIDERVAEVVSSWRHRWLAAIGADALPEELSVELANLDGELGAIENPLTPRRQVTSWVGPNSPITQDEMAALEPAELVSHLESWHDPGDGWGPEPSHEGQGRSLTALLTTSPLALEGVDGLVRRLRPTYLRAIIQGWEAALKASIDPDWAQVAEVTSGVLSHSNEPDLPVEGGDFDDDPDFRGAKRAAIELIEELVKKRDDSPVPAAYLAVFAALLLDEGSDETAWDEYDGYSREDDMDPLTISINWQWPIRLRGLVNLLAHGSDAPWYDAARAEFEREIARPDRRGASRAVIGESLGRLLNVDEDWMLPQVAALFGGSADNISRDQQIALTTAIMVHHYHSKLYTLLSPGMLAAIHLDGPMTVGWDQHDSPIQRIGEWVINAIMFGHKTLDDPLAAAFFFHTDPQIRGDALGHIAWSFMHEDRVDDDIRDRLGLLWDERVAHVRDHPDDKQELKDFYWFVRSHKFPDEWWLPRLKETAELFGGSLPTHGMIGKTLAVAARTYPRESLEALVALLGGDDDVEFMSGYDLKDRAVPHVIAHALDAGDPQLASEANEFMNRLGAEGFLDLESRVNDVRNGVAPEIHDD